MWDAARRVFVVTDPQSCRLHFRYAMNDWAHDNAFGLGAGAFLLSPYAVHSVHLAPRGQKPRTAAQRSRHTAAAEEHHDPFAHVGFVLEGFPVVSGVGCTAHHFQGATLEQLLIVLKDPAHLSRLPYGLFAMLCARVHDLQGLSFLRALPDDPNHALYRARPDALLEEAVRRAHDSAWQLRIARSPRAHLLASFDVAALATQANADQHTATQELARCARALQARPARGHACAAPGVRRYKQALYVRRHRR